MIASKYSVLMSVYYKEKTEYLRQAIETIQVQTIPTDDFVLVCDSPPNNELDGKVKMIIERKIIYIFKKICGFLRMTD